MVVDVAEVFAQARTHLRHAPAEEAPRVLEHRPGGVLEGGELLLDIVERLDAGARVLRLEKLVLDRLELRFHGIEHRKVAVDHRVHQRIEHVAGAVAQQLRLALGARAHAEKALLAVQSHREHVVAADEDVDLADLQLVTDHVDGVHHDEQQVAVFLDLRPLVPVARVLHRQRVQVELLLHRGELVLGRIAQRHPHEAAGALQVVPDVALVDVGELAALLVGDAVDERHIWGSDGTPIESAGYRPIRPHMPDISRRAACLGTENAFVVLAEVNALARTGRDIISFCIGQPDFPAPDNVQDAAIRAIRAGKHGYTPSAGIDELRDAAARYMGAMRGALPIRPQDVVVGAGAKPFIAYAILSTTDYGAGDEVIYPNPGFPIYESQIVANGAKPVPINLHEKRGFSFDPEELARLLTKKTRLLILNYPHNPTGGCLTKPELERIAAVLQKHPHVASVTEPPQNEGGGGATVVELRV